MQKVIWELLSCTKQLKRHKNRDWLAFRIVVLIFDVHIFFLDIFVTIFEAIICITW